MSGVAPPDPLLLQSLDSVTYQPPSQEHLSPPLHSNVGKTFVVCFICIESIGIAQSICRETFTINQKSAKTVKLFPRIAFVVYSKAFMHPIVGVTFQTTCKEAMQSFL